MLRETPQSEIDVMTFALLGNRPITTSTSNSRSLTYPKSDDNIYLLIINECLFVLKDKFYLFNLANARLLEVLYYDPSRWTRVLGTISRFKLSIVAVTMTISVAYHSTELVMSIKHFILHATGAPRHSS